MKKSFCIGDRLVGEGQSCYVIAEIGSNHDQSLSLALDMISLAAQAGADAVKFQSILFSQIHNPALESNELADWFRAIELDEAWYPELIARAKQESIEFISSPTYPNAVDLLEQQGVRAYKIASPQFQASKPVLSRAAITGKPLIMSVGYAEYGDIVDSLRVCRQANNQALALLHCVSKYPIAPKECNLRFMRTLSAMTGLPIGFSDHSLGIHMALAAVALDACIVEKHVTVDRKRNGPDHHFAATFAELSMMIEQIREIESGVGDGIRVDLLPEEYLLRGKVVLKAFAKRRLSIGDGLDDHNVEFRRYSGDALTWGEKKYFPRMHCQTVIESGGPITWTSVTIA